MDMATPISESTTVNSGLVFSQLSILMPPNTPNAIITPISTAMFE